jgi:hypothetical protein
MTPLSKLVNQVIMRRSGLKANYKGTIIDGCDQCGENVEDTESIFPGIAAHRCRLRIERDGKNALILDPGDIPKDCPYAMVNPV